MKTAVAQAIESIEKNNLGKEAILELLKFLIPIEKNQIKIAFLDGGTNAMKSNTVRCDEYFETEFKN